MENDEDRIIITEEKKVDTILDRIRNSLLASAAIFIVAILSRYIFNISEDYSLALLITAGLPTLSTIGLWILEGKRIDISKKYGVIVPTVAILVVYLAYTLPNGFYLMLIPIFFLAFMTSVSTGMSCLYFNKIINSNLTYKVANKVNFRIRVLVAIGTATIIGICMTLLWYYFGLLEVL